MRWAILIVACVLAPQTEAECTRLKVGRAPPGFDGPGSWGPLHNTVTLDCLTYAGSMTRDQVEYVLIRDERGTVYRLKVGDFMGEKSGYINKVDESFIYIEQYEGSQKPPTIVKFPKGTMPARK